MYFNVEINLIVVRKVIFMESGRARGFTLVELIIVIAILAILAGIAIPSFINANMAARGSKILADMNACESAVNIYYAKNGSFPADSETIVASYLAGWPKSPVGLALIKKHDNTDLILDVQTANYIYIKPADGSELDIRIGRITLGGMTIEELLTTSATNLTLVDED